MKSGYVVFFVMVVFGCSTTTSEQPAGKVKGVTSDKFSQAWRFSPGSEGETLLQFDMPPWTKAAQVELPHRHLLPNTAMWYFTVLDQPISNAVLNVRADDGAQAFLNHTKLERLTGDLFVLEAGQPGDTLVIRVLNNAMAGGLADVSWLSLSEYNKRADSLATNREPVASNFRLSGDETDRPVLSSPVIFPSAKGFVVKWLSTQAGKATVAVRRVGQSSVVESEIFSHSRLFSIEIDKASEARTLVIRQGQTQSQEIKLPSPQSGGKFSFSAWADSQGGWDTFAGLMAKTATSGDAFSIGAGDLVANGSDSLQWMQLLLSLEESASAFPFYLVPGNHDYDGYYDSLNPANFYRYISTPSGKNYFSWQFANCAFIALDMNGSFPVGIDQEQQDWFSLQLRSKEWLEAGWHFVVLHQPPFSQGWPGYHGEPAVQQLLEPLYESSEIDFVLAGHTHDYERMTKSYGQQRVHFFVLGGAGGGLESEAAKSEYPVMDTIVRKHHLARFFVDQSDIRVDVLDLEGELIDQVKISKK